MTWRDRAACRDQDPQFWDFDEPDLWRRGAAICNTACLVQAACLEAALDEESDVYGRHGRAMIRGGLTPNQRSRLADGEPTGIARSRPVAPIIVKLERTHMTDDAARIAHNRFNAGERDSETRAGERRYQRLRARIYRAARKVAAS